MVRPHVSRPSMNFRSIPIGLIMRDPPVLTLASVGCKRFQSREAMDRIWTGIRAVCHPLKRRCDKSDSIIREAACRQHANENNDGMNAWHNAAKSYKKSDPEGWYCTLLPSFSDGRVEGLRTDEICFWTAAVSALHQAIKLLVQAGNFRQAADREKEVSFSIA